MLVAGQSPFQSRDKSGLIARLLARICHFVVGKAQLEIVIGGSIAIQLGVRDRRNGAFLKSHGLFVMACFAFDNTECIAEFSQIVLFEIHERRVGDFGTSLFGKLHGLFEIGHRLLGCRHGDGVIASERAHGENIAGIRAKGVGKQRLRVVPGPDPLPGDGNKEDQEHDSQCCQRLACLGW